MAESKENQHTRKSVEDWPNAVTYEIFVQSFADSNGDGIGDLNGVRQKLDYLEDLGVKAIWLLPIHPSPSYHKYDVTDYYRIHPDYGTMEDFKKLVQEAHERDIKVIMDFIVNHTARDHPWFQKARKSEDNPFHDYYVWKHPDKIDSLYKEESADSDNITQWHETKGMEKKYYGFFWGGMPDLNFDNPDVRQEIFDIGKFWLREADVDGFRLDAAKHIYPDDRAQDTHEWWAQFQKEMQSVKEDVYLVGEVWDDTENVAPYFKSLDALFNFDMAYAMVDAVKKEKPDSLVEKHLEIRDIYRNNTESFIDATFIRNHDQNRVLNDVNGHAGKAKQAASILMTLPGTPYIYYGEEIGMKGQKPDPNIREPFLWKPAAADSLRTSWIEPKHSVEGEVIPLSQQMEEDTSFYNHYKRLIHARNQSHALTYGQMEKVEVVQKSVCAFKRVHQKENMLVIHNLGRRPVKVKQQQLPSIKSKPYYASHKAVKMMNKAIEMPPFSTVVVEME